MATKQDIEKSELKEKIVKLRNENKGYETNVITLQQQKQETSDSEKKNDLAARIQFFEGRISANDRQIEANDRQLEEKEKQITAQIKEQEKRTTAQIEEQEKRNTAQIEEQEKRTTEQEKQTTFDRQINLELIRNQGKSAASSD